MRKEKKEIVMHIIIGIFVEIESYFISISYL